MLKCFHQHRGKKKIVENLNFLCQGIELGGGNCPPPPLPSSPGKSEMKRLTGMSNIRNVYLYNVMSSSCISTIIMFYLSLFLFSHNIFWTLKMFDSTNLLSIDIITQRTILYDKELVCLSRSLLNILVSTFNLFVQPYIGGPSDIHTCIIIHGYSHHGQYVLSRKLHNLHQFS